MRRLAGMSSWSIAVRLLRSYVALLIIISLSHSPSLYSQAQLVSALVAPTDYQQQTQVQQPVQNIPRAQSESQFQSQSQVQTNQAEHQHQHQQQHPQHQSQSEQLNPISQESPHQTETQSGQPGLAHTQPQAQADHIIDAPQTQQTSQQQQPQPAPTARRHPETAQQEQRPAQTYPQPQPQPPPPPQHQTQAPQLPPPQQQPAQPIQSPQTPMQMQSQRSSTPIPQPAQAQIPLAAQAQQQQQQVLPSVQAGPAQSAPSLKYQPSVLSPLYLGHNPFIEILRPLSYADDNIVTLNLSHSHIYEIDSEAFVGQRFEHIDLSNNKLGLIHSKSFRIGPNHSRYNPNNTKPGYGTRRPPPAHPKSVTIDLSHNPAIVALSGAFDHIDVPNCLLNFTNSTVELKYGSFKRYLREHPGHLIDIDTVDCCDQEWLLGYKHNFVARTHCAHDPNLYLLRASQQTIIDSCIAYVTSARHSMAMPSSGIIHLAATNGPRHNTGGHSDNQQYLTYLILGGTAMVLTSLSIYIIFYMFSLKAAFVNQMQTQENRDDKDSDVGVSEWHVSRYDMANAAASRRAP